MSIHETGSFSLTDFIEEASRRDQPLPPERFSRTTLMDKTANKSLMTVTVRVKARRPNYPVVSVVAYERRSKGFVNTPLLRLIVVSTAFAGE